MCQFYPRELWASVLILTGFKRKFFTLSKFLKARRSSVHANFDHKLYLRPVDSWLLKAFPDQVEVGAEALLVKRTVKSSRIKKSDSAIIGMFKYGQSLILCSSLG